MSTFGEDLIQSLNEALAHANGEGPAIVHAPISPREVRIQAKRTQTQPVSSQAKNSGRASQKASTEGRAAT